MRRLIFLLLISGCCVTAGADEPTIRKVPPVSLPLITQEAEPAPLAVTVLPKATWFIVQSIEPVRITGSRDGFIKVREHVGAPEYNFIGLFVDSGGEVQERTYPTSPEYNHVYSITSVKPGEIELLVITPTDILRQTLVIEGPRPPPGPEPEPDDPPVPPQPVRSFRVIFVKESGDTLNPQQSAIPGAKAIRDYLNAKCTDGNAGWTEFDPDQIATDERPVMRKLWDAVKPKLLPAPCLVIEVNGHATVMPFPADVTACMATLKKHGGE